MNPEKLKYPIGKYQKPETFTADILGTYINEIKSLPARLRREVEYLSEGQLNTPYRPEGWTVRQVVNHCSDSHMNGIIRLKLALTEEKPVVRPYLEAEWAELADSKDFPIEPALKILDGIHRRWAEILSSLSEEQWQRKLIHPQGDREMTVREITGHYNWHGNHHLAHITSLKERKGWS